MKRTFAGWRSGWAIVPAALVAITLTQAVSFGQEGTRGPGKGNPKRDNPDAPAKPMAPRIAPGNPQVSPPVKTEKPTTPQVAPGGSEKPRVAPRNPDAPRDPETPRTAPGNPQTPRVAPANPAIPVNPPRTVLRVPLDSPIAVPGVGADVRVRAGADVRTGGDGPVRHAPSWYKQNPDQNRDFRSSMNGAFRPRTTDRQPGDNNPSVRDNDRPATQADWLRDNPKRAQYWSGWGNSARTRYGSGTAVYYKTGWWNNRNMIGYGGNIGVAGRNTWWGYQPWGVQRPYSYWYARPAWTSFTSMYGWSQPYYYDYGTNGNVVYQGNQVLVNGRLVGTPAMYSQSAAELAALDTSTVKVSPEDWIPLGTFAIATSDKDENPIRVIQLAATKDGLISGSMYNSETDKTYTVQGRIDKDTQRVAFTIGDNQDLVLETGLYNLTQEEAPVLVHFGPDKTANYVFVRLPQPDAGQPQAQPTAVPTLP